MDAPPASAARPQLTDLPEAARAHAQARFAVLRPHLDEGVPLTRIAQTRGIPLRTLHAWLRAYRQTGLAGLARKGRADRGRHRLPMALVELIQGLALRTPRPSVAAVYRQVVPVARSEGWPVPAYSTVTAIVRGLDPAAVTLAHDGAKAYANSFDLVYRREASRPNDIWQADHCSASRRASFASARVLCSCLVFRAPVRDSCYICILPRSRCIHQPPGQSGLLSGIA